MDLNGRVAIVTGGGTGIGRAVCLRLAKAGAAAVIVNYSRSEGDAKTTASEVEALGAKAVAHKADVADESQVVAMIQSTAKRFCRLDVLANNALTTHLIPTADLQALSDNVWDAVISCSL